MCTKNPLMYYPLITEGGTRLLRPSKKERGQEIP